LTKGAENYFVHYQSKVPTPRKCFVDNIPPTCFTETVPGIGLL